MCRCLRTQSTWCSLQWTATTSASLPTARQALARPSPSTALIAAQVKLDLRTCYLQLSLGHTGLSEHIKSKCFFPDGSFSSASASYTTQCRQMHCLLTVTPWTLPDTVVSLCTSVTPSFRERGFGSFCMIFAGLKSVVQCMSLHLVNLHGSLCLQG